jgi:hypothetical protein
MHLSYSIRITSQELGNIKHFLFWNQNATLCSLNVLVDGEPDMLTADGTLCSENRTDVQLQGAASRDFHQFRQPHPMPWMRDALPMPDIDRIGQ